MCFYVYIFRLVLAPREGRRNQKEILFQNSRNPHWHILGIRLWNIQSGRGCCAVSESVQALLYWSLGGCRWSSEYMYTNKMRIWQWASKKTVENKRGKNNRYGSNRKKDGWIGVPKLDGGCGGERGFRWINVRKREELMNQTTTFEKIDIYFLSSTVILLPRSIYNTELSLKYWKDVLRNTIKRGDRCLSVYLSNCMSVGLTVSHFVWLSFYSYVCRSISRF